MGLSRTVSEIMGDVCKVFPPSCTVFNGPLR